jgi:hypothetical protein
MLERAKQEALIDLLHRCVVRIEVGDAHGTGFFVAPKLVLTAFHVVQDAIDNAASIEVVAGEDRRPATVREGSYRPPEGADIALLDVESDDEQPCVVLDETPVPLQVQLALAGFPEASQVTTQTRFLESGTQQNWGAGGLPYLRVDDDPLVGGMSGGPVLNLETGFISGVVRLTLDPQAATGGFATPTSVVVGELPELRAVHDFPPPAAQDWCDILEPLHLKTYGRHANGTRWDAEERTLDQISLSIHPMGPKGSPLSEWEIKVDGQAIEGGHLHGSEVGTDVLDAVDLWSQRRAFGRDDSQVLGRILWRALLPESVERRLEETLRTKGLVLLRVKVSQDDRLAKIPWEYAIKSNPPGDGPPLHGEYDAISAMRRIAFSRYVDAKSQTVKQEDRIRVLMAIVRPAAFRDRSTGGTRELSGTPDRSSAAVKQRILGKDRAAQRIELTVLVDPAFDRIEAMLEEEGPWHAVHYVGFGSETDDRSGTIAFVRGGTAAATTQLTSFKRLVTSHPACRLVVMQLCSAPGDRGVFALDPRKFLDILAGPVQALVVGQHASTPDHVLAFSQPFYEALANGDPVEFAVQRARRDVGTTPPANDAAAFGTITVTTTSSGELRLLTRSIGAGRDSRSDSQRTRSGTEQQADTRLSAR